MTDAPPPGVPTGDARSPLGAHLWALYRRRQSDGTARTALAEMRRAAADPARRGVLLEHVGRSIPGWAAGPALDAHLLVAELFGLAAAGSVPLDPGFRGSLGRSARAVDPDHKDTGVSNRFKALLPLPAESLPDELRRFVRLLVSRGGAVDIDRLLQDLLDWDRHRDDPHRSIQRRWARDFWPAAASLSTPAPLAP